MSGPEGSTKDGYSITLNATVRRLDDSLSSVP